jgi:hypothetical protein
VAGAEPRGEMPLPQRAERSIDERSVPGCVQCIANGKLFDGEDHAGLAGGLCGSTEYAFLYHVQVHARPYSLAKMPLDFFLPSDIAVYG